MPQASLPISLKTGQESYNITSTLWCFQRRCPSLLGFKYIISYRNYSIFQKKKKKLENEPNLGPAQPQINSLSLSLSLSLTLIQYEFFLLKKIIIK